MHIVYRNNVSMIRIVSTFGDDTHPYCEMHASDWSEMDNSGINNNECLRFHAEESSHEFHADL